MRTPAIFFYTLVQILAGFLIFPNLISLRTMTLETSDRVNAIVRARLAYLVIRFQTLVYVNASFIVQRQIVSHATGTLVAVRFADTLVRTIAMSLAVVDFSTRPTVRFQREIVGTLALVSVTDVHANMTTVVSTGALVQIYASFFILVQGEILGTVTNVTAIEILALVRTIVKIRRALVDVLAGTSIVDQFVPIETAAAKATFGVVTMLRAKFRV